MIHLQRRLVHCVNSDQRREQVERDLIWSICVSLDIVPEGHARIVTAKVRFVRVHRPGSHLIRSQRARLVRAYRGGAPHDLACLQMLHEILLLHHFIGRERQRQRHRERQALGHGHGENGDGHDDVLYDDVLRMLIQEDEALDAVDRKRQQGGAATCDADMLRYFLKLNEEGGIVVAVHALAVVVRGIVHPRLDFSRHGVDPHGDDHHLGRTLHCGGATQDDVPRVFRDEHGFAGE
mmetsp:Transcript_4287/g.10904  ORF Transcript_4287/g.10904 Transcript_4287/m.10904 type:complete len:236 (-) Transcript_4287:506-1213(-)